MYKERSGHTGGEIVALIAPVFDMSPEDINHAAIIVATNSGELEMLGCKHAKYLVEMVNENATRHAFNTRSHHEGNLGKRPRGRFRTWLGSLLLPL